MKKVPLLLFVTFISVLQLYAASHGKCGSNLTWTLSYSGDLVVSGEGAMNDFGSGSIPWNPYLVKTVTLEEGITLKPDTTYTI